MEFVNWKFLIILLITCSQVLSSKPKRNLASTIQTANVDCSATSVIGFAGKCITLGPSLLDPYIPADLKPIWDAFSSIIPSGLTACFGDFKGADFATNDSLSSTLCKYIPVDPSGYFGVVSFDAPGLPCGAPLDGIPSPVDAAQCIAFDKCGTLTFSMNLGVSMCIASYVAGAETDGIVPLIASFSDAIPNIGLGFSIGNRFTQDVPVAWQNGNSVSTGTVTARGSVYFQLAIAIPTDWLKFDAIDLSDIVSIEADLLVLLDLGKVEATVSGIIGDLKSVSKSTAKQVLNSVLKLGAEYSVTIDGTVTIGLSKLTKGILCDFSFTLAQASILISSGNGNSGMSAGIYYRVSSDIVSDLINSLQGIWANFTDVLKAIGIDTSYNIPPIGIELGAFISTTAVGFQFDYYGFTVKCFFRYSDEVFSCSFNDKLFSVIKNGLNYLFKSATQFFDTEGSILKTVAQNTWNAASKAISSQIKADIGTIKDLYGNAVRIDSDAFKLLKTQYNKILSDKIAAEQAVEALAEKAAAAAKALADKAIADAKAAADAAAAAAKAIADKAIADAKAAAAAAAALAQKAENTLKRDAAIALCKVEHLFSTSNFNKCKSAAEQKYP